MSDAVIITLIVCTTLLALAAIFDRRNKNGK